MQSFQSEPFYPLQAQTRTGGSPNLGPPYDEYKMMPSDPYDSPERNYSPQPLFLPLNETHDQLKASPKLSTTQYQDQTM